MTLSTDERIGLAYPYRYGLRNGPRRANTEMTMTKLNNEVHELNIDELDAVSGGMRNQANDPGFHRTFATSFGPNNGSPLYGNGSFHDTIDNNHHLP